MDVPKNSFEKKWMFPKTYKAQNDRNANMYRLKPPLTFFIGK